MTASRARMALLFPGCPLVYLGLLVVGEFSLPVALSFGGHEIHELASLTGGKSLSNVVVELFAAAVLGAVSAAALRIASPRRRIAMIVLVASYAALAVIYVATPLLPE